MFGRKKQPSPAEAAAKILLESARGRARAPALFGEGRVPDTIDGRFEAMVLHAALLVNRLRQGGPEGEATAQALFDALFADFDSALRELGAADLGLAKRIRRMAEAFYGRLQAYRVGLAESGNEALETALARNLFATSPASSAFLTAAAAYVRDCADALAAQRVEALAGGEEPRWPALPA
jgi:cytochrome b pre-mRNA-processing protein 3